MDVLCERTGMSRLLAKQIASIRSFDSKHEFHRMIDPVQTGDIADTTYTIDAEMPFGERCAPSPLTSIFFSETTGFSLPAPAPTC